jgi:hypothetical protein
MSLDSWLLGSKTEDPSWTPDLIGKQQKRRVLGILGGHKRTDFHDFQKTIINDILVKMGSAPDLVLLSDEGKDTSGLIYMWAEQNNIPVRYMKADWTTAGKSAGNQRDTQIIKDSSAFIIFAQPRSDRYTKLATKLQKKKLPVVLVGNA